jgi:hypothetical protein
MGKNPDPGSGMNIPDPQHWYRPRLEFAGQYLYEKKSCRFALVEAWIWNALDRHSNPRWLRILIDTVLHAGSESE